MLSRKTLNRRGSFELPEGFGVCREASLSGSSYSGCGHYPADTKEPVSITLISTATCPEVTNYSDHPENINSDAFSVKITLITQIAFNNFSPLDYLHNMSQTLSVFLNNFTAHFFGKEKSGNYPAARAEYSFQSNFRIFLLNFVWLVADELFISTMTITDSGVEKGGNTLQKFVESITCHP